jgi:ABC-type Fe3+-citrate transport system substrate-binding protein
MMKATFAILIVLTLLTAGCSNGNNDNKDQKTPVYFVPPTAHAA